MLLTLYDQYGNEKAELQANDNSTQDKEVQADNVLSLGFTLYAHVAIDVNDYVDFCGERYWAVEKYEPAEKSSVEWEYSLKLYGIESLIKRFLVLNNTDGENEAVFTLTARPVDHVRLIVKCINEGMGTTDFKVGSVEGTDNVVINYEGKYCDEALKELAEAVGVEWWFDGETLNLSRCEWGSAVVLGYGEGLTSLEQDKADNVKFYTRLYPIGSSRNIDRERYGASRLQLPGGAKYVDMGDLVQKYGVIHHYEQEAFSGIYPRRVGVVSSVRSREVQDSDGKPYTIYYFKDNGLTFDPNAYEIGGLVKHVSFQEGSELAGLGADNDHYFEVNFDSETREFEIITIWPYDDDRQLPGDTLVPKPGDKYILWNIRMPDEYYTLAETEFLSAVEAYNRKHTQDVSRYKAPTDHVWIEDTGTELEVGRRVRLKSQEYFPRLGYRESRITRISRSVNLPSQMDIEISDALSSGTLDKIDDAISDAKSYAGSILGAVNVPDIIKSWEDTKPTDNNLFSARKSEREFLSKRKADTAQALITFLQGIALGDGTYGIDGNGEAILHDIKAQNALFTTLTAQEAHFFSLIIDEVKSVGGQLVITPANCTADLVEPVPGEADRIRVFFQAQDSDREISNEWQTGDQAVHYEFDTASGTTRNYWRLVVGVSSEPVEKTVDGVNGVMCHWIDLSLSDCKSGSSSVEPGDHISMLGNRTDTSRQNAIIISAYNIPFIDTAPYLGHAQGIQAPLFASYTGISSFTITEANRLNVISGNGNLFSGTLSVRSTLADGRPVNDLGTQEGNLLRNTAFTGDFESEPSDADTEMTADTPLWSDPFNHWEHEGAQAADYSPAKSGRCVTLTSGTVSQNISAAGSEEWYMLSFYAYGSTLSVSALGHDETLTLTPARTRYDIAFQAGTGADMVTFSGTCILSDIILTKGTLPVEWQRSPLDSDTAKREDMANDYLRKAIAEASTTINGGLVLTQMLKMGLWRRDNSDGVYKMTQETGGLSGVMNDNDSPYVWGGGTMQQAINAIDFYKTDPTGEPTSEDLETFAKFVVTHGGRAIMEDVILRGYVYALGGKFKGEVEALSGIFKNITSPNGSFSIDNAGTLKIVNMLVEELGKIASAIFSGDYMISQYGKTLSGQSVNNYDDFDPSDPDNPLKFAPNIYLNFLTGKVRLANADITGSMRMIPKHVFGSADFNMLFVKDNTTGDYSFSEFYPKSSLQFYYMPTDGKVYVSGPVIAGDLSFLAYEGLEFTVFNISGVDYYIKEFTDFVSMTVREKRISGKSMARFKIVAVDRTQTWGYLYSPVLESLYEI